MRFSKFVEMTREDFTVISHIYFRDTVSARFAETREHTGFHGDITDAICMGNILADDRHGGIAKSDRHIRRAFIGLTCADIA